MSESHPQGSKAMSQNCVHFPITDQPDELTAHVRICGGIGPVMADSTRNPTAHSAADDAPIVPWHSGSLRSCSWVVTSVGLLDRGNCMCWRNKNQNLY